MTGQTKQAWQTYGISAINYHRKFAHNSAVRIASTLAQDTSTTSPQTMKRFDLRAPIRKQLERILEDYPGGQLLSEALQNADDSEATSFSLLLDLRHHQGVDDSLAGPAFVLIDNGKGFGEREWRSIQNLNASEKRNTPSEIGRFGMGSRSFFHYSDETTVVSRGSYVGVDPLETVGSHGRGGGGWRLDLEQDATADAAAAAVASEARALFELPADLVNGFDWKERGAMFRLPLRRAQDVQREREREEEPLGAAIPIERAAALMREWAEMAPKLLLFLSSMTDVALWQWADGAAHPECLARVEKRYAPGSRPFSRLPPSLPDTAVASYRKLSEHLLGLGAAERERLAELHVSVLELDVTGSAMSGSSPGEGSTAWLVAQRFDVKAAPLVEALRQGSEALPIVGVAVPMSERHVEGVPFCFLPIGNMKTGLPLHVHGAFASTPNRRMLWLPGPEVDGKHADMARWNDALMRHAVPRLWVDVLKLLGPRRADLRGMLPSLLVAPPDRAVLCRLPDLDSVQPAWRPCAEELYTLLMKEDLLPHTSEPRHA